MADDDAEGKDGKMTLKIWDNGSDIVIAVTPAEAHAICQQAHGMLDEPPVPRYFACRDY